MTGCGGHRLQLPTDPGAPLPDFDSIHTQVSAACAPIRTLTAEISLAGQASGERLRGTLQAGFKPPESMRLELRVGPFGTPAFVLGANAGGATLMLPRSNQVVRGARAEDVLGALTGISLSPADLLAILTGCVVPSPRPTAGRLHADGWASIQLADRATLYLQRVGNRWQLRAARRGDWQIEYPEWPASSSFPTRVQLRAERPVAVDLRAGLSQVEADRDLGDEVFTVNVPADAERMTVEQLRQAGPLREP